MAISKLPGAACSVTLTFSHRGPGGTFDVGIGLAPSELVGHNPVVGWFPLAKAIPAHSAFTSVSVVVTFAWPSSLGDGNYDTLKFIQVAGGPRDPGGGGFLLADWDEDVYGQAVAANEFSGLTAIYA